MAYPRRALLAFASGVVLVLAALGFLADVGGAQQRPRALPAAAVQTPMQRADALLRPMTIEEKAMQLSSVFPLALFDTPAPRDGELISSD